MTNYSLKKVALLATFGLAVFAAANFALMGMAAAAEPSVQTSSATNIFDDSAKLNGYLYTGGEDTTYWFEYGTSRSSLNRETSQKDVGDRDGRTTVSNTIQNGLIAGRTYYFRLVAENVDGTDRGDILSFVADDNGSGSNGSGEPTVRTISAQVRGDGTSATLRGSVDPNDSNTQVWFRFGRTSSPLSFITDSDRVSGDGSESFSLTALRLTPGSTYYYQAVAQNSEGTDYGETLYFTTPGNGGNGGSNGGQNGTQAPAVSTNSASSVGRNSATLSAQVNPNGTLSSIWFEYGRTSALGSVTTRDPAGSGNSSSEYRVSLSGLSAGTTYFYRAVAQNSFGTNRGLILSFRTEGSAPAPSNPPANNGGNNNNGNNNGGNNNPPQNQPISVVTSTPAGAPGCFTVSPTISSAQLEPGADFTYSVTYRNTCGNTLTNGSLQITLPQAAEFADTNYPFLSRDGNLITYNLGVIAPNFQSSVTVSGKVRSQANVGDSLIFQANITFTDPRGVLQNASGFLSASVVGDGSTAGAGSSTLGASAADALSGLFHSGWFWLVLFLILLALFVFWLATRRRDVEDEEEEAGEHGGH